MADLQGTEFEDQAYAGVTYFRSWNLYEDDGTTGIDLTRYPTLRGFVRASNGEELAIVGTLQNPAAPALITVSVDGAWLAANYDESVCGVEFSLEATDNAGSDLLIADGTLLVEGTAL